MLVDHPRSLIVARYLVAMAQPWRSHLGILWWPPNGKHDDILCVGALLLIMLPLWTPSSKWVRLCFPILLDI
jgi:hypothetical protein